MADDAGLINDVMAETSFLYGSNAAYIEELHEKWANDPGSVSAEWKAFFDQLRDNAASVKASAEAGAWGRGTATEPNEANAVFDGRWPAPKPDPKKPGAAPAPVAAKAAPVEVSLVSASRYACRTLVTILGPGADDLTALVEKCKSVEDLTARLEKCRDVIQGMGGRKKADEFWAGVTARLPKA